MVVRDFDSADASSRCTWLIAVRDFDSADASSRCTRLIAVRDFDSADASSQSWASPYDNRNSGKKPASSLCSSLSVIARLIAYTEKGIQLTGLDAFECSMCQKLSDAVNSFSHARYFSRSCLLVINTLSSSLVQSRDCSL